METRFNLEEAYQQAAAQELMEEIERIIEANYTIPREEERIRLERMLVNKVLEAKADCGVLDYNKLTTEEQQEVQELSDLTTRLCNELPYGEVKPKTEKGKELMLDIYGPKGSPLYADPYTDFNGENSNYFDDGEEGFSTDLTEFFGVMYISKNGGDLSVRCEGNRFSRI